MVAYRFFKNDRYSFSKISKRVGRFQKRSLFSENETMIFVKDRKTKRKTRSLELIRDH